MQQLEDLVQIVSWLVLSDDPDQTVWQLHGSGLLFMHCLNLGDHPHLCPCCLEVTHSPQSTGSYHTIDCSLETICIRDKTSLIKVACGAVN